MKKKPKESPLSVDGRDLHIGKTRHKKRRAAINLGSAGGKKRARTLSKERLSEIGRMGGLARHGLTDPRPDPAGSIH